MIKTTYVLLKKAAEILNTDEDTLLIQVKHLSILKIFVDQLIKIPSGSTLYRLILEMLLTYSGKDFAQ